MSEDKSQDTTAAETETAAEAESRGAAKAQAEADSRAEAKAGAESKPEVSGEELLGRPIRAGGEDKTFGEVTLDDARAMAADLKAKVGWGPTARVATIARGWDDLGRTMVQVEAATVADLDGETVIEYAKRVWVLPPYDQMLF